MKPFAPRPKWTTPRATAYATYAPSNLTGNVTLVYDVPAAGELSVKGRHLVLNPGAVDRNVTLPAVAESEGVELFISVPAGATNRVDILNPAAATLSSLGAGESAICICANGVWYAAELVASDTGYFADDKFYVYDDGDRTKRWALQVSGVTAGQTRVMTVLDRNWTPGIYNTDEFYVRDTADTTKRLALDLTTVTTGTDRTVYMPDENVVLSATASWLMAVTRAWGVDVDGAGGGLCGADSANAAFPVAQILSHDVSDTYYQIDGTSAGADYTADWQILPDTYANDDAVYFGFDAPYPELYIGVSATNQTYTGDGGKWQYWNGSAWTDLPAGTFYDGTDANDPTLGTQAFGQDGCLTFLPPTDWASSDVSTVTGKYWLRWIVVTAGNISQDAVLDNADPPDLVSPEHGFEAPQHGRITRARFCDGNATLHTAADVKFFVWNYTQNTGTALQTWAQDKAVHEAAALTLDCSQGDSLGIVCIAEDGTNEPTNVHVELTATVNAS